MARGSKEKSAENAPVVPVPPGWIRCIIEPSKLRKDTAEEHVRQRIARSLIEDYGYTREEIEVEFSIKVGSAKGKHKPRLDLAIFKPNQEHTRSNVFIAIECKKADVKERDKEEGTEQLLFYMDACASCRFGMWIGSTMRVFEKITIPNGVPEFPEASDIPRRGFDTPRPMKYADLVPAGEEDLVVVFKRCHNYVYANQGLSEEPSFHEFLKLIFCKVYDENRVKGDLRFYISSEDRRSLIGQKRLMEIINDLFGDVKRKYPYIFKDTDEIGLKPDVLAYIVTELQRYSLTETPADAKGKAYEELVGVNLLGKRGEYFTPRNVCDMATRMVFATFPRSKWGELRVLDPACGTGGFLVSALGLLREVIREDETDKHGDDLAKVESETASRLKEIAGTSIFGIDFNPTLVRSAQMNMVMHGDGSTNIFHADSLAPPGEWPRDKPNDVYGNIKPGWFDIVITNPPFSAKALVEDAHTLEQYEIAKEGREGGTTSKGMPPERLFVERCLSLVRPGGRVGIVVPQSILDNPGLVYIRRWLLRNARILASVSLPAVTFQPRTGTKTSVLILERKKTQDIRAETATGRSPEYSVFMATPEAVGHDPRGEPVYLRTPDGDLITYLHAVQVVRKGSGGRYEVATRREPTIVKRDELPEVARLFEEWWSATAREIGYA
jgi:type I restriction enzyme M protein